jgi:hypothetical protein
VHTYRIIAFCALKKPDPREAAELWETFTLFCETTIKSLKTAKDKFPYCTTVDAYNVALDYWESAKERYQENLADAECQLNLSLPNSLMSKSG